MERSLGRVTLQDLADQLGLSKFAVSRALTGKPGVSDETRRRVAQTAQEMGYARPPGPAAAGRQIHLVFHDEDVVNSEMWVRVLHGAQSEAASHGIDVVVRMAAEPAQLGPLDPGVVGLALAGPHGTAMGEEGRRLGVPVVRAGWPGNMEQVDQVIAADWEASLHVARYLVGLGHRSLAYIHGETGLRGRVERWRGFRDGLEGLAGISLAQLTFPESEHGFRDAFMAMAQRGTVPTALFCAHDGIAVTVVSALGRMSLRVPEDISVVGYQDFVCATQIVPRLTTVRVPMREIGVMIVRCLLERLTPAGAALPARRIQLVPEFIERASTGNATGEPLRLRLAGLVTT